MKFDLVGIPDTLQDDAPGKGPPSPAGPVPEAASGVLMVRRTAERASARAGVDAAALASVLGRLRERAEATGSSGDDALSHRGVRPPANFRTAAFSPVTRSHDEYSA